MDDLLFFILKTSVYLIISCIIYALFFKNRTFHAINRWYLLLTVIILFTIPVIENFPAIETISNETKNFVTPLPLDNFRFIAANSEHKNILGIIIIIIYFTGLAFYFIKLLLQMVSLCIILIHTNSLKLNNLLIYKAKQIEYPFSFFNIICVNPEQFTDAELKNILLHESIHVKKLHSIDVLLGEICKMIFWFNPFAHLLLKWIKENIEFETDRQIIKSGIDSKHYQYNLLKITTKKSRLYISNQFNIFNLKKRVIMMNKNQTSRYFLGFYGIAACILLSSILVLNSCKKDELLKDSNLSKDAITFINQNSDNKKYTVILDGKISKDENIDVKNIVSTNIIKNKKAVYNKSNVLEYIDSQGEDIYDIKTSKEMQFNTQKESENIVIINKNEKNDSNKPNPLYVLDGVKMNSIPENINKSTIKSMNVIKGKHAVEKYGQEGRNGVIEIATK